MPTASTNPPKVYRWPGSPNLHTVPWEQQKANVAARHPAAPATPAAPVSPTGLAPLAQPVDPVYDQQVGAAQRRRATTQAGLVGQGRTGLAGYGYTGTETTDPVTGAVSWSNFQFNPNDPFSKAMLLKRTYDQSRAKTAQGMGSTGGLYAGAFQKAQDLVNIGQLQDEDTLQKSLIDFLTGNTASQTQANTDYETDVAGYAADRLGRIADNPLYEPDSSAATTAPTVTGSKPQPTLYRWPTDPKGKPPSHTIPYSQHQQNTTIKAGPGVKATSNTTVNTTKKGRTVTHSTTTNRP